MAFVTHKEISPSQWVSSSICDRDWWLQLQTILLHIWQSHLLLLACSDHLHLPVACQISAHDSLDLPCSVRELFHRHLQCSPKSLMKLFLSNMMKDPGHYASKMPAADYCSPLRHGTSFEIRHQAQHFIIFRQTHVCETWRLMSTSKTRCHMQFSVTRYLGKVTIG